MRKGLIPLCMMLVLAGCATQPEQVDTKTVQAPVVDSQLDAQEQSIVTLVNKGYEQLARRNTLKAFKAFEEAVTICDQRYPDDKKQVYAARTQTEALYYLVLAAKEEKEAVIVNTLCSDALFLRSYSQLDLGRVEDAEAGLQRAVAMAPMNAWYLSELGHIKHVRRQWQAAMAFFERAEKASQTYSPPNKKQDELLRAKRGIGFSLIELQRLEEAETKFQECLDINPDDIKAQKELQYIQGLRQR